MQAIICLILVTIVGAASSSSYQEQQLPREIYTNGDGCAGLEEIGDAFSSINITRLLQWIRLGTEPEGVFVERHHRLPIAVPPKQQQESRELSEELEPGKQNLRVCALLFWKRTKTSRD